MPPPQAQSSGFPLPGAGWFSVPVGSTPTMSPHYDDLKYGVVERVLTDFRAMKKSGEMFAGPKTAELVTVNGVRAGRHLGADPRLVEQAGWMVVVFESLVSSERHPQMLEGAVAMLRCSSPEVGVYDQDF